MAKRAKPLDRLTIISLAAQKEGLSYGKYMVKYGYHPPCLDNLPEEPFPPVQEAAIPEHLQNTEPEPKPRELRKCRCCGKTFEPDRRNQFYCHQECYREENRARQREKALTGKVQRYCVVCGEPLPLSFSARQLTCSKECSIENRRTKGREKSRKSRENRKQASGKGE